MAGAVLSPPVTVRVFDRFGNFVFNDNSDVVTMALGNNPGNALLFGGTAQRAVIRLANRTGRTMGVHMIVTNVPGPQNPLYFDGARCLFTSGMAPVVDGMGIIHAVTSYQGQFVACFTADRDMMPDPAFYAGCIEQAFADLKEAAGVE